MKTQAFNYTQNIEPHYGRKFEDPSNKSSFFTNLVFSIASAKIIIMPHNKKSTGRFLKVPYTVFEDQELSDSEKLVFSLLYDRSQYDNKGSSFEKYEYFMRFGYSIRTIRRIFSSLKTKKYITISKTSRGLIVTPIKDIEVHSTSSGKQVFMNTSSICV